MKRVTSIITALFVAVSCFVVPDVSLSAPQLYAAAADTSANIGVSYGTSAAENADTLEQPVSPDALIAKSTAFHLMLASTYDSSEKKAVDCNGKLSSFTGEDDQKWILDKNEKGYILSTFKTYDNDRHQVFDMAYDPFSGAFSLPMGYSGGEWQITENADGSCSFRRNVNGMFFTLSADPSAPDTGENVIAATESKPEYQSFFLVPAAPRSEIERYGPDEEYAIVPVACGGASVDVQLSSNRWIQMYKTHRGNNQIWTFSKSDKYEDHYFITSKETGKVAQLSASRTSENYYYIEAAEKDGSDKQLWSLELQDDGTYMIRSKRAPDLVWDMQGGASVSANGVWLQAYPDNNWANQRFCLVHISTTEPVSQWGASRSDCKGTDWDHWDGSSDNRWYYKDKNAGTYYISTAAELAGAAQLVRDGVTDFKSRTIVLTRDLNLGDQQWEPIGTAGRHFWGSFNGGGHAIIGLNIESKDDRIGFFGYAEGGTICNFAIKGKVTADERVGGVVGVMDHEHLSNIYSEVIMTAATDDYQGGICGKAGYTTFIEHCTQNARVTSGDKDPYRGGICGQSDGIIRYCVNRGDVDCNWNYVGGIVGAADGGKIEYCANYGTVGGGGDTECCGGIIGEGRGDTIIFGCYNEGKVYSTDDDYIGGIAGKTPDFSVYFCVNRGRVYGDDRIGGITGNGVCLAALNMGVVTGDSEVGAVSGKLHNAPACFALSWTSMHTVGNDNGLASWAEAEQILDGSICSSLNRICDADQISGSYRLKTKAVFTQCLGCDPYPTFGSSTVIKSDSTYRNDDYNVSVECDRSYGSVSGAGTYRSGTVTLRAIPAAGADFDHFEVISSTTVDQQGWDGNYRPAPGESVRIYDKGVSVLRLTDNIDRTYRVRAVFTAFDEIPPDQRITAKIELKCTDDADGWNSDIIPVELVDSAGEHHPWQLSVGDINTVGKTQTKTFYLGGASPVAVYAYPDFGGGLTFRSYGMKVKMWINDSGTPMESGEETIRSGLLISSKYGDDYLHIPFPDYGSSVIGRKDTDGTIIYDDNNSSDKFSSCKTAWSNALSRNGGTVIKLKSAWLTDNVMEIGSGKELTVDLNGYPIIRSVKKTRDNGEIFNIKAGGTLNIIDSSPQSRSTGSFTGGSIQGGRSDNTGGLIECAGTLNMNGGTLYNGGTTDKGGAIRLTGSGSAELKNMLISNCWSDKARTYDNDGGAVYMRDKARASLENVTIRSCRAYDYGGGICLEDKDNRLSCVNVSIKACKANDNEGGAVYQDDGSTNWTGGCIMNCSAPEDDCGGFYQNNGDLYLQNINFENNCSGDNGGAYYFNYSDSKTWMIGCTFLSNKADGCGGALYLISGKKNFYMEDCTVMANSAGDEGGGSYVGSGASVDINGVMIIRNNDGAGSYDNLVLEKEAYVYDNGVQAGSDIHLCSEKGGGICLSGNKTSQYKLENYYHADYGRIELSDGEKVNTQLSASVFSDGKYIIYIGSGMIVLILAATFFLRRKGKKGGAK